MHHMQGHRTRLSTFKKTEIISSIFSDYNGLKLEISCKKTRKKQTCRLNNTLLNKQWVNEEIKEEIKKYLETNENGNTKFQNRWNAGKVVLRGKFIVTTGLLSQNKKNLKQSNLTFSGTRNRKKNRKNKQRSPKLVEGRKEKVSECT